LKVLVLGSFAESLVTFRGPLLKALVAARYEVHAAAPDLLANVDIASKLVSWKVVVHDVPIQRTGTNPIHDLRSLWALRSLMLRFRPDAVLTYTAKPVIYGSLAAALAGVPRRFALVTGLGYAFTGKARGLRAGIKSLLMGLYRLALGRCTRVFFQNPDDRDLFRDLGLLPARVPDTVVSGSGIDVQTFSPAPLPSDSKMTFLLIARLLGDKGVREYAAAARQVRLQHPEVRCQIAGWIDHNPDAIDQSELDGWIADGDIEYLGRLSDVRPAIANSHVYVLPSYREGTPRTVLEAMAMGRPVITTDAPGCRQTVVDGDNGYLVPVQSADALAEAMLKFVEDPSLLARMGSRSRQIAEEKFDVNNVNAVMLQAMDLA
jgi:glycosyltransferase involved in cell wall biosynthesis